MIRIHKGKEPHTWFLYRTTTANAEYKRIPELVMALLREQGYICAYCTRRIPTKSKEDQNTNSKIDHIRSQADNAGLQLSYDNMAICCPGYLDRKEHCDTLKKKQNLTFDLYSDTLQNGITYGSKDGKLESSNAGWQKEIETVLNLNHPRLSSNRAGRLSGLKRVLKKGKWNKSSLTKKLGTWTDFDAAGKKKEYCGIVIWYLKRKLSRMT